MRILRASVEVSTVSPERHDETVAAISHLPGFLASALCSYLGARPHDDCPWASQGLRNTTRIAGGEPQLWKSIARHHEEIGADLADLNGFSNTLAELRRALHNQSYANVEHILTQGKRYRDGFL